MIPLFTTDQIRKADRYAFNQLKIPGIVLMENAARSIFDELKTNIPDFEHNQNVGIICGEGNNGGDGFAVARLLANDGFYVNVISIGKKSELKGDALTNFNILFNLQKKVSNIKISFYKSSSSLNSLKDCSVIIDAILGTGAKGGLKEPYDGIVKRLNSLDAFKVAIDVPTGLDADKGSGELVFNSDFTITLAELKRGLYFGKGYSSAGDVLKGRIGIGDEYFDTLAIEDYLVEPEDAFLGIPLKELDAQKYSAGKVLVVAGSGQLPGAAFFTANSAIKNGAGAVVLAFPESLRNIAQIKLNEATVATYDDDLNEFLSEENVDELKNRIDWADVVTIGPGLGREESTFKAVQKILVENPKKCFVIDADGVVALGSGTYKKLDLSKTVLTPHHKEFATLIGVELETLQNDLLKYGKSFTKLTGAYLVLKGAPTIIFTPDGEALINTTGNPGMAKFGTGDVLTGILSAFISAGRDFESAIISAVYLHSLAADLIAVNSSELTYTADDILNNFKEAVKFLEDSII